MLRNEACAAGLSSKLLLSKVLICSVQISLLQVVSLLTELLDRGPLPEERVLSANPISKYYASPDLGPISSTTTRLVPAPAASGLAGGEDHDKLTTGEHSGRGAVLGVTNWVISAAALSLGGATLPSFSLAGPAFAGHPLELLIAH